METVNHLPAITDENNKVDNGGQVVQLKSTNAVLVSQELLDKHEKGMNFIQLQDKTNPVLWNNLSEEDKKEVLVWADKEVDYNNKKTNEFTKLIPGFPTEKISDGFHTFGELYDMRLALTRALFKALYDKFMKMHQVNPIWKSEKHEDGTMFEGYFVVGAFPPSQHFGVHEAITFHYPMNEWGSFWFAATLDKAPPFDGHTTEDVIQRLRNL